MTLRILGPRMLLALAPALLASAEPPALPQPLLENLRAARRNAIRTGLVEFTVRWGNEKPDGVQRTHYYRWRCAGDEFLVQGLGDDEGVFQRGPDRQPARYAHTSANQAIRIGDEVWQRMERAPRVEVWEPKMAESFQLYDLRRAGLNPISFDQTIDEHVAATGSPPLDYRSYQDGDLTVVSGSMADGEFRWWLDPQQGWSVVKIGVFQDGAQIGEQRFTLREVDGAWFPQRIEHVRLAAGETEPSRVIEVLYAEFNRPEHPQRLTLADIGVEVGMRVQYNSLHGAPVARGGYWDGSKVIDRDEFLARLEAGELVRGPTLTRELHRGGIFVEREIKAGRLPPDPLVPVPGAAATASRGASDPPAGPAAARPAGFARGGAGTRPVASSALQSLVESEWEAYTRRVIAHYELTRDQTEKAQQILNECQSRAHDYLRAKRAEIDAAERRVRDDGQRHAPPAPTRRDDPRAAPDASATPGRTEAPALLDAQRELARLRAPIEAIFNNELRPRLHKLPSEAQRQAAEKQRGPFPESAADDARRATRDEKR
ncbi:MAG: hypothetical protein AB7Q17_16565 [Phycisphaerae bacterium]